MGDLTLGLNGTCVVDLSLRSDGESRCVACDDPTAKKKKQRVMREQAKNRQVFPSIRIRPSNILFIWKPIKIPLKHHVKILQRTSPFGKLPGFSSIEPSPNADAGIVGKL
jgi:hypothetical protein